MVPRPQQPASKRRINIKADTTAAARRFALLYTANVVNMPGTYNTPVGILGAVTKTKQNMEQKHSKSGATIDLLQEWLQE